jgi:predicted RNase H-like nuclease (RuvC/YqgF family)
VGGLLVPSCCSMPVMALSVEEDRHECSNQQSNCHTHNSNNDDRHPAAALAAAADVLGKLRWHFEEVNKLVARLSSLILHATTQMLM